MESINNFYQKEYSVIECGHQELNEKTQFFVHGSRVECGLKMIPAVITAVSIFALKIIELIVLIVISPFFMIVEGFISLCRTPDCSGTSYKDNVSNFWDDGVADLAKSMFLNFADPIKDILPENPNTQDTFQIQSNYTQQQRYDVHPGLADKDNRCTDAYKAMQMYNEFNPSFPITPEQATQIYTVNRILRNANFAAAIKFDSQQDSSGEWRLVSSPESKNARTS